MRGPADDSWGASGAGGGSARPLERFKPTTGAFAGYAGLAVCAFAVAYTVVAVHTVTGLRIALGATFAAAVVWATQLRPRATAYSDRLLLQGSLRDTRIPYVVIDEVTVTQMLNVFVGEQRYVCIGIGTSIGADIRSRAKKERQSSLLGRSRGRQLSEKAELAAPDQTAMSYTTFVVTRIEELVDKAKKEQRLRGDDGPPPQVWRGPAWLEVVALVVTGLAFLGSLFL